jgi:hypothetical protein
MTSAQFTIQIRGSIDETHADNEIETEVTEKQIHDYIEAVCDPRELDLMDAWNQEIQDISGLADHWVREDIPTQTEADWYEGLYEEFEDSPDEAAPNSRILAYGAQLGVPDIDSALHPFCDVLLSSDTHWSQPGNINGWNIVGVWSKARGAAIGDC